MVSKMAGVGRVLVILTVVIASALLGAHAENQPALEVRFAREWYKLILDLVRHTATYSPPVAARAFAYLGLTLHEVAAINSSDIRSLAGQLNGLKGLPHAQSGVVYDRASLVDAAMSSALTFYFYNTGPSGQGALKAMVKRHAQEREASGVPSDVAQRSIRLGRAIARSIFKWSLSDGGATIENLGFPLSYPIAKDPSQWVPTSTIPLQQTPLLPSWGDNRTFVLSNNEQCLVPPTIPYSEDKNSAFYAQALEVYTISQQLTAEQKTIARFWADDPMLSATPPGHWVGILTKILEDRNVDLETFADGQARLSIAVADAFIGCWHSKYKYNLLRPISYVIHAYIDPKWQSLIPTPPFPEYPSGHATQSGAAAEVLTRFFHERFGEDHFAFTDHTHDDDGFEPRAFASVWDAAREAAMSRLYGGIHYRSANDSGLAQGKCIGARVNALQFRK